MRISGSLGTIGEVAKEEPTGATVSKAPSGPAAPSSGWSVALADAFGAPFGTGAGQNNLWYPNTNVINPANSYQQGHNSNELQVFNSSQVHVTSGGLVLDMTYSPNVAESYGTKKNYVGGEITSVWGAAGKPSGYNFFRWKPCQGGIYVFEFVAKLPPTTEEMNPAFWSLDAAWTNELDMPEWWGWEHPNYFAGCPVWKYKKGEGAKSAYHETYNMLKDFGVDPVASFNKFTTVINADNSMDFYVNGSKKWSVPGADANGHTTPKTGESPPLSSDISQVWMGLVFQNAARLVETNFKSGTRSYLVRSVAVYRDGAHAGLGVEGGGVAPGTTVV